MYVLKKGKEKKGMLICKRTQDKKTQSYTCKKHVSLPDAREVIPSFQTPAKKIKAIFTLTQITKETKPFSAFICSEVSIEGGFKRTISQAPDHYHCFIAPSLLLMLPPLCSPPAPGEAAGSPADTPCTTVEAFCWTKQHDQCCLLLAIIPMGLATPYP